MSVVQEQQTHGQLWLETATKGIRYGPDRKAVAAELAEHIQDKAEDLQRIFPALTGEQAMDKALEQMGDAHEIGKALAKIHKPWLGYLWRVSKLALGLLVALCLFMNFLININYRGHPIWSGRRGDYTPPQQLQPEWAREGGYTFRILEASFLDYPEGSVYQDQVQVVFQVSSPRFWERIDQTAIERGLTVVTRDAIRWPMDRATINMEMGKYAQVLSGLEAENRSLFQRTFCVYVDTDWRQGDWVTLEFSFEKGDIQLSAQLTREVTNR